VRQIVYEYRLCCCPISPLEKKCNPKCVCVSVCVCVFVQARKAEPVADGKVLVSAPGGRGGRRRGKGSGEGEGLEIRASE
jgi:hypothetical protein